MTGPDQKHDESLDALVNALANPLASRLLSALARRPRLTSKQLAELVGEPVHKVNYQMREMLARGLAVIAVQGERRGAMERRFEVLRRPLLTTEEERRLTLARLRRVRLGILRLIGADITAVLRQAFHPHEGDCLVRVEMDVDRSGWEELSEIFGRSRAELLDVWDRSSARLAEPDAEVVTVTSALVLLELPPAGAEGRRG